MRSRPYCASQADCRRNKMNRIASRMDLRSSQKLERHIRCLRLNYDSLPYNFRYIIDEFVGVPFDDLPRSVGNVGNS